MGIMEISITYGENGYGNGETLNNTNGAGDGREMPVAI